MPELLNLKQWQNQVRIALAHVPIITRIHALEAVNSTNDYARKLAQNGAPAGTLVIAREQSAGRGRLDRIWESPANLGLWFSLVLHPKISAQHSGLLGFLPAIALVEVLHQIYQITAGTKWPNDVWINRKKIAGILCESQVNARQVVFAVIGMGINIYQKLEDFPEFLRPRATSIQQSTPLRVDAFELLKQLLTLWGDLLWTLESGLTAMIIEHWKKHCVHMQQPIWITGGPEQFRGKFVDLSPDGAAIIENDHGERKRIFVGESILLEE